MLTQLGTVATVEYVAVWNNQLALLRAGTISDFSKPACFLEISSQNYGQVGAGCSVADLFWKIHVIYQELDGGDGTMDEMLSVFDLRDSVKVALTSFKPTNCTQLMQESEAQDYNHDNLYHYILSFKCAFVDTKGSYFDTDATTTETITGVVLDMFPLWVGGTAYIAGKDAVIHSGAVYLCATSNSDTTFTSGNWTAIPLWVSGTSYTTGNKVVYSSEIFICAVSNIDSTFVLSNWTVV